MLPNAATILTRFRETTAKRHGISFSPEDLAHEHVAGPHRPPPLRGIGPAVYVFSLRQDATALAGPNRVLKVGKVGASSAPRFTYQHYKSGSAQSTLAGSLETYPILWDYLGIPDGTRDMGAWLMQNTDRDHYFLSAEKAELVTLLEVYVRGIAGPVFEGSSRAGRIDNIPITTHAE